VKLEVRPEELAAAAARLAAEAGRLDDATTEFARRGDVEIPMLGRNAVDSCAASARRTEAAVRTIAHDLDELARAMRMLAELYVQLDRSAVRAG
jgi:uncharacterized protein YukE